MSSIQTPRAIRRRPAAASAVLLLVVLASCRDLISPGYDGYGAIHVEVVDQQGAPAAGVDLELRHATQVIGRGITNRRGIHRFDHIPTDTYLVVIRPPEGYVVRMPQQNPVVNVEVEPGGTTNIVATVRGLGALGVVVVDHAGQPVPGARLTLFNQDEVVGKFTTGDNGVYFFEELAADTYGIVLTPPPGYAVQLPQPHPILGVVVLQGDTTEVRAQVVGMGALRVTVRDQDGLAVAGTRLMLFNRERVVGEGLTGDQGRYLYPQLVADTYGIVLTPPPGYVVQLPQPHPILGVVVVVGDTTDVTAQVHHTAAQAGVAAAVPSAAAAANLPHTRRNAPAARRPI